MAWLTKNKIAFSFHNYKDKGISKEKLEEWFEKESWELLFNKRSTTWKELPATVQEKINNPAAAIRVMVENNSIIKRPVVEYNNKLLIGFNENEFKKVFK